MSKAIYTLGRLEAMARKVAKMAIEGSMTEAQAATVAGLCLQLQRAINKEKAGDLNDFDSPAWDVLSKHIDDIYETLGAVSPVPWIRRDEIQAARFAGRSLAKARAALRLHFSLSDDLGRTE